MLKINPEPKKYFDCVFPLISSQVIHSDFERARDLSFYASVCEIYAKVRMLWEAMPYITNGWPINMDRKHYW